MRLCYYWKAPTEQLTVKQAPWPGMTCSGSPALAWLHMRHDRLHQQHFTADWAAPVCVHCHIQAAQSSILCADGNDEPIWSQAYGCHRRLMLSLYNKSHHVMLEMQTERGHYEIRNSLDACRLRPCISAYAQQHMLMITDGTYHVLAASSTGECIEHQAE